MPDAADEIGAIALRLAKDGTYRHRAAEDLLRIAGALRAPACEGVSAESEREAFEAHIRATWRVPADYLDWALSRNERGDYLDSRAADQFSGWQAARATPPAPPASTGEKDVR